MNETDDFARAIRRHIGIRMTRRRNELGIEANTLAAMLNVSRSQFSRYESGVSSMNAGDLQKIATALDVTVAYFFESFTFLEELAKTTDPIIYKQMIGLLEDASLIGSEQLQSELMKLSRALADDDK